MLSSFYNSPTLYYKSPCYSNFDVSTAIFGDSITEEIARMIREQQNYLTWTTTCPNAVIKLTNEKETKKMKAKKCDRCGKLYENPVNGENCGAEVRFRYLPVDGEENLSEKKIIEKQTKNIYISSLSVDVDICPDCRESFKRWFENG